MPDEDNEKDKIDNQQVNDAEYPSDELSISAFTLHLGLCDG
jgi:hypothetical protein